MVVHKRRTLTIVAALIVTAATSFPARGEKPGPTYYSSRQALAGAHEYAAYCVTCHGVDLRGPQLALAGPTFASLGKDTGMTLGQFFDFIVRDTPAGSMKSLSHEQYAAIMAYILQKNGYLAGSEPLRFERALRLKARVGETFSTADR